MFTYYWVDYLNIMFKLITIGLPNLGDAFISNFK